VRNATIVFIRHLRFEPIRVSSCNLSVSMRVQPRCGPGLNELLGVKDAEKNETRSVPISHPKSAVAEHMKSKATLNKCILHMFSGRKREPSARLLSPNQSLA
jgi:hypothetical protein